MRLGLLLVFFGITVGNPASAQEAGKPGTVGIRFGVGTDIEGGLAYGAQLNYTLNQNRNGLELGLAVYGGSFEEESDNGFNVYKEETSILVVGAIANYLFRWAMALSGPYFLAGIGVGAISVEWEERSDTDSSLGTPLPGGGSMQSEEGSTAGVILNFGIGYRFTQLFDLRAQVPTFFISGGDERDGKVVPTITITAGLNF
jgi:hypothetical protein